MRGSYQGTLISARTRVGSTWVSSVVPRDLTSTCTMLITALAHDHLQVQWYQNKQDGQLGQLRPTLPDRCMLLDLVDITI
jgi:hypothetical protein